MRGNLLLASSLFTGTPVVLLRVSLVPEELGVHTLARDVLVLLRLLDAVPVRLIGLVVRRVVFRLGHGYRIEDSGCERPTIGFQVLLIPMKP